MIRKKYRIKVIMEQKSQIFKYQDAQRCVYNWATIHLQNNKEKKDKYDLSNIFTKHKHEKMKSMQSVYFNMSIKDLYAAFIILKNMIALHISKLCDVK